MAKRTWDSRAIWSRELLSSTDADADPGIELVIECHSRGESDVDNLNYHDNYLVEDREPIEAYIDIHLSPGESIRVPLSKDVMQRLYDEFVESCDPDDLSWPDDQWPDSQ